MPASSRQRRSKKAADGWLLLEELQVVGGYYHRMWEAHVDGELPEGQTLAMRPEPHNMHDVNAIAVDTMKGTMLGYIPREKAEVYSALLRCGVKLRLRVMKYIEDPRRLNVRMYISR